MFDRIESLDQKLLIGRFKQMSYDNNQTASLWQGFMPLKKQISNLKSTKLYAMQVYSEKPDFRNADPSVVFTKWAAVEVCDHSIIPENLHPYVLEGGLYAVFIHRGTPDQFQKTFDYIFLHWLPQSGYEMDHREHFELLPNNYKPDDPEAKEEIWIPIVLKPNES